MLYNIKLLHRTGSQRPHRSCPLANKVENIDCGNFWECSSMTPKLLLPVGEIWAPT